MQDAVNLVYTPLHSDAPLITLLGGRDPEKCWDRVYDGPTNPQEDEFPRITMFEVLNEDAVPADDKFECSDVNVRIDFWTKDKRDIHPVCKRIKKVLGDTFMDCIIRPESTMYETDTGVYHKPINVFLLLEQESD